MRTLTVIAVCLILLASAGVTGTTVSRHPFHRCNWCGINAACVSNICRCLSGFVGYPYFICFKPAHFDLCQFCDDPVVTTENGDNVAVHYLDSTLLFDKAVSKGRLGTCHIRVVVSNYRLKGKSFPRCVFVRYDLKNIHGQLVCSFGFQICGFSLLDGSLRWQVSLATITRDGRTSFGPWKTIRSSIVGTYTFRACNNLIYFKVSKGRILTLEASCCPFHLGFRPFIKRIFWLKTGIFILTLKPKVRPAAPSGSVRGFPICLRPGLPISYVEQNLRLPDRRFAMSFLALTNLPPGLVYLSPERKDLVQTLVACPAAKLQTLFRDADFILFSPLFIREISGTTKGFAEVLKVAKKIADWFCKDDAVSCRNATATITDKAKNLLGEPNKHPKLVKFKTDNCKKP
ncbi:hypothetical protein PoB_005772700 [Plakobranchus ocellatus]|uniref:Uncharacterized protein n=1 Tax=Plakobranchus ocellatus TaxID=259542 RepID=A0AAV4CID2_9GAST|nr:hypothetical protein PoB_005772700 [Plakobranchus ocellatus]